jgi:hypothetical protein
MRCAYWGRPSSPVKVARLVSRGIWACGLVVIRGFHGPDSKLSVFFSNAFWGLRMLARFSDQSSLSVVDFGRLTSRPWDRQSQQEATLNVEIGHPYGFGGRRIFPLDQAGVLVQTGIRLLQKRVDHIHHALPLDLDVVDIVEPRLPLGGKLAG